MPMMKKPKTFILSTTVLSAALIFGLGGTAAAESGPAELLGAVAYEPGLHQSVSAVQPVSYAQARGNSNQRRADRQRRNTERRADRQQRRREVRNDRREARQDRRETRRNLRRDRSRATVIIAPNFGLGGFNAFPGPGRNFAYRGEFRNRAFHNYSQGWRGAWDWGWGGPWNWGFGFQRPYYGHFWGFGGLEPRWRFNRFNRFNRFGGFGYRPIFFTGYNFNGCFDCGGSAIPGAFAGGILGGLIGSEIDGGSNRTAGTLIGSLAGAAIGASLADEGQGGRSRQYRSGHSGSRWFETYGQGSSATYQQRVIPARPQNNGQSDLCLRYRYENGRYVCTQRGSPQ